MLEGLTCKSLVVTSPEILSKNGRKLARVRCTRCGQEGIRDVRNVLIGRSGCPCCRPKAEIPGWLLSRCRNARRRCTDPTDPAWKTYGARGIRFEFATPRAMGLWVKRHLGLHRELQIDRIDNDGPYAPHNLRLSTRKQNLAGTGRARMAAQLHAFRAAYPRVLYCDGTLKRLLRSLSWAEIVKRYDQPSKKPKGVYGTFTAPDPYIVTRWLTGQSHQVVPA